MRVISFSNHKGGVGKTTSVANIGSGLSINRKVLLIDLDPQANLTISFGLSESEKNIYSYISNGDYEIINIKNNQIKYPNNGWNIYFKLP
ncbi:MAG: ParA family protein [Methylococcaceae bacterium]|nr:ParA family protein [Methylococcaceae bacterium]